ncbi:MAG: YcxB family protein, partial [Planctomycetales bacterium]|nr:YcxB family protein [Planctomycetales bacterium]
MTSPVSITFTYTRDEYILAMKRHYCATLKVGRDVIGGLLAMTTGIYLLFYSSDSWAGWALTIIGAVMLLMVIYALFVLPGMIYYSQPKLKDEYSLVFSDEGIDFKTNSIESQLHWSIYQSWLYDDDFFILYYGKRD